MNPNLVQIVMVQIVMVQTNGDTSNRKQDWDRRDRARGLPHRGPIPKVPGVHVNPAL